MSEATSKALIGYAELGSASLSLDMSSFTVPKQNSYLSSLFGIKCMSNNKKSAVKTRKKRSSPSRSAYRGTTAEITLKLILSWAIAIASLASAVKLLPYHLSQQAKLKELRIQVQETEARVVKLREQLNKNFDPQQTKNLMEQYSSLLAPNQSRIYWLPEDAREAEDQGSRGAREANRQEKFP